MKAAIEFVNDDDLVLISVSRKHWKIVQNLLCTIRFFAKRQGVLSFGCRMLSKKPALYVFLSLVRMTTDIGVCLASIESMSAMIFHMGEVLSLPLRCFVFALLEPQTEYSCTDSIQKLGGKFPKSHFTIKPFQQVTRSVI